MIGASTSLFGAVWAQAELRKVLTTIGAHVVDADLPVAQADRAFDAGGSLRDPALRASLAGIVDQLLLAAGWGSDKTWIPKSADSDDPAQRVDAPNPPGTRRAEVTKALVGPHSPQSGK